MRFEDGGWRNGGKGSVQVWGIALPTVTLSVNPASIGENGVVSTVTATLSSTLANNVTVGLATSGTATGGGVDYNLASTSITIPAGQTTGTTTVTSVQDIIGEGSETVILDIDYVVNCNIQMSFNKKWQFHPQLCGVVR